MTSSLLLRVDQVAEETQLHQRTIRELIASGEIPVVRIGRAVRVPRAWLEQWIQDRTTDAATPAAAPESGIAARPTG